MLNIIFLKLHEIFVHMYTWPIHRKISRKQMFSEVHFQTTYFV